MGHLKIRAGYMGQLKKILSGVGLPYLVGFSFPPQPPQQCGGELCSTWNMELLRRRMERTILIDFCNHASICLGPNGTE